MITSDIGLSMENYVGTYQILKYEDQLIIISNEVRNPCDGEQPLKLKTLYVDDFKNYDYLLVNLANVDVSNNESILEFCNKYGLPYSMCKTQDVNPGYYIWGMEVNEEMYEQFNPLYRHDYISMYEFKYHVACARQLMEVKNEIESNNPNYENLIQYLLPMLLYSKQDIYDDGEIEPKNSTTRFQKYYRQITSAYWKNNPNSSFVELMDYFISTFKNNANKTQHGQLQYDIVSDYWTELTELLHSLLQADILTQAVTDGYSLSLSINSTSCPDNIKATLLKLSNIILNDIINEGLSQVSPKLTYLNGHSIMDWNITYQFEGLLIELSLLLSAGNQVKKCANPTCEKFFIPIHRNKRYCCHRCASNAAKQRQRARDAEDPNRERLEPGFKSRKK